ncbi:MAG: substrate-binding domain-containing protein [Planctomycetaceae bacterium]
MPGRRRVALMLDLAWPYKRHVGTFAGTQRYAQEHGWESTIDEFAYDTLPARRTKTVRYDGVIARATTQLVKRSARNSVPVVNVWHSSPVFESLPGVFADHTATGRLCADHLLSRGFRNFAVVTSPKNRAASIELQQFRRLISDSGCTCVTAQVPQRTDRTVDDWRRTEQTITKWMDSWQLPIGIRSISEPTGRLIVQMCLERGWRVPEDVAIIAGSNEETLCENPRPSLTSVEIGHERIGYEAARLLDHLMDEKDRGAKTFSSEHIILPPKGLVVRESTDFFAVNDSLVAIALEVIAAQSHRPIGPSDVASAVSTELRTLQRRFSKYLGRPIATEIRRVRIERARRELTQTDRSIANISRDVGFGESMRMYEVFVRELGVTPSEYRKQRTSPFHA